MCDAVNGANNAPPANGTTPTGSADPLTAFLQSILSGGAGGGGGTQQPVPMQGDTIKTSSV